MTSTATPVLSAAAVSRARAAVLAVFALNGLIMASWISRVPAARDRLDLASSQVGLVLLAMSGGAVLALPLAGAVIHRIGTARTVQYAAVVCATGLVLFGLAPGVPVLALGLLLLITVPGLPLWAVSAAVVACQAALTPAGAICLTLLYGNARAQHDAKQRLPDDAAPAPTRS